MSSDFIQPVLSICIPTFERAECLRTCLRSITEQMDADPEVARCVEVVLGDNASGDHTGAVAREFQAKYPQIVYFRNDQDLFLDRNLINVVNKARGEYCWLLGDDDALFPGSLKFVLNEFRSSHCAYYLANFWGYDRELKLQVLDHPNFRNATNQSYQTLADFVRQIGNYKNMVGCFGGISIQIFKRELWQKFDKTPYIDTSIMHFFVILAMMKNQSFMLLGRPLVKVRSDNMRYNDSVPSLATHKARVEGTKKSLIWMMKLYDMPVSEWRINWFFFKDSLDHQLVQWIKFQVFTNLKARAWASKWYKKIFSK